MDIKKILIKLGYHNKCSVCGHESVSWGRLIGEIIFVLGFSIVLFLYLTVELPALKESANCTVQMLKQYQSLENFTIINGTPTLINPG